MPDFELIVMKLCIVIGLCLLISSRGFAQVYKDHRKPVEERVQDALSEMTLKEKLDYIGGYNAFYIRPIKRLGLPAIKMTDGPVGVHKDGKAIAYPATILAAATWDTTLLYKLGYQLGRDARARGAHILLAPGVNIYRAPMAGRNFEYMGEDPYLTSRMAVNYIKGLQSTGVVATVKHFAANNQEWDRNNISSDIDERTLHEIYLPAFKAAVTEAHVGAVMNSYNLVNGQHATQNDYLNNEILKKQWGFDGVLMSDWDATYDGLAAAKAGLDLEMPSAKFMNAGNLLPAINQGVLKVSVIDDKVRRILRMIFRNGFFDHQQLDETIPKNNLQGKAVALDLARSGIVLLKNENKVLPIATTKYKTIAVIGPNANSYEAGGGSSYTFPFSSVSVLKGIRDQANGIKVIYAPGITPFSDLVANSKYFTSSDAHQTGLKATYFNNNNLSGRPVKVTSEKIVSIHNGWAVAAQHKGVPFDHTSIRYEGFVKPLIDGEYQFTVRGFDGFRLWVDGKQVIDLWRDQGITSNTIVLSLKRNKTYPIKLEYYANTHPVDISMAWALNKLDYSLALQTAAKADVAIVCAGFNESIEKESVDRPFKLPDGQDELIAAVAKANSRTVVLLNAGGGLDMKKWIGAVKGILDCWYPGQEGGKAIAEILFGKVNPSGRLPVSFERSWADNPVHNNYYDTTGTKRVSYKEGLFLGYRFYDTNEIKPLFPFGYGLSYTSFNYSDLVIQPSGGDKDKLNVRFTVKNTGNFDGAAVSQVYVHQINSHAIRPYKELKAFSKNFIKRGASQIVNIQLSKTAFAYYKTEEKRFDHDPGKFEILIGSSSDQILLKGIADIQ